MLGRYEDSRAAFELALKRTPREFAARVHRGAALNFVALGDEAEADRHFRKAIESGQSGAEDPRVDYGAFLFRQGKTAEASKQLNAAVSANPESARANLECGRVLLQLGHLEDAVKRLEVAVRRNPADANAHLLLGRAYQRLGRDADAERELKLGEREWRRKQQP
jgi:Tfp pilus assembly protein PilF